MAMMSLPSCDLRKVRKRLDGSLDLQRQQGTKSRIQLDGEVH